MSSNDSPKSSLQRDLLRLIFVPHQGQTEQSSSSSSFFMELVFAAHSPIIGSTDGFFLLPSAQSWLLLLFKGCSASITNLKNGMSVLSGTACICLVLLWRRAKGKCFVGATRLAPSWWTQQRDGTSSSDGKIGNKRADKQIVDRQIIKRTTDYWNDNGNGIHNVSVPTCSLPVPVWQCTCTSELNSVAHNASDHSAGQWTRLDGKFVISEGEKMGKSGEISIKATFIVLDCCCCWRCCWPASQDCLLLMRKWCLHSCCLRKTAEKTINFLWAFILFDDRTVEHRLKLTWHFQHKKWFLFKNMFFHSLFIVFNFLKLQRKNNSCCFLLQLK